MTRDKSLPRRRWRNFYVPRSGQWLYGLWFAMLACLAYGGTIAATVVGEFHLGLADCGEEIARSCDAPALAEALTIIGPHIGSLVLLGLLTAGASFVMGVVVSHRTYGPTVAIERHIDALIAGQHQSRVHLRKYDHMKGIADRLNDLAARLDGK